MTAADDLHWQALASKWDCALLGPVIHQPEKADCRQWSDPRKGSGLSFLKALKDLGQASGHPELAETPLVPLGAQRRRLLGQHHAG